MFMQETVTNTSAPSQATNLAETATRNRRTYSAPKLVELGSVHELTRGDIGANPDLGTTQFA